MTTDQELQAKIAALRASFTAGLAARFEELTTALAAIRVGESLSAQTGPVKIILEQTHKIAGSAGTFGYSDMSAIASQAEQLCDRILKNEHGDDAAAARDLGAKIDGLRAALRE